MSPSVEAALALCDRTPWGDEVRATLPFNSGEPSMTTANRHSIALHLHDASRKAPRVPVRTYAADVKEPLDGLHILALGVFAMGSGFSLAILLNPLLPF